MKNIIKLSAVIFIIFSLQVIVYAQEIENPDIEEVLTAEIYHAGNSSCDNGRIVLTVIGGYSPYTYEWTYQDEEGIHTIDNPEEDLNQLGENKYCVTVTDALCGVVTKCWDIHCCNYSDYLYSSSYADCTAKGTIIIRLYPDNGIDLSDELPLSLEIINLGNNSTIYANLGIEPYTISSLDKGTYEVNIHYKDGCTETLTKVIDWIEPIMPEYKIDPCSGWMSINTNGYSDEISINILKDGEVDHEVFIGGSSQAYLDNYSEYVFEVKTIDGCVAYYDIAYEDIDSVIDIDIQGAEYCSTDFVEESMVTLTNNSTIYSIRNIKWDSDHYDIPDGSTIITGVTGPVTLTFDIVIESNPDGPGINQITQICSFEREIFVQCCTYTYNGHISTKTIAEPNLIIPRPNCGGEIDITGLTYITNGLEPNYYSPPYTFSWTGPDGFISHEEDISGLCPGEYCVTVDDGCDGAEECFVIPACDEIEVGYNRKGSCLDFDNGVIRIYSKDVNIVKVIWSDGYEGFERSELSSGYHSMVIMFEGGCQRDFVVEVRRLSYKECESECGNNSPVTLKKSGDRDCTDWCGDGLIDLFCDKLKLNVDDDIEFSVYIGNSEITNVGHDLDEYDDFLDQYFTSYGIYDVSGGHPKGWVKYWVVDHTNGCVYEKQFYIPKRCGAFWHWILGEFGDSYAPDPEDDCEWEYVSFDEIECSYLYYCELTNTYKTTFNYKKCSYSDTRVDEDGDRYTIYTDVEYCKESCNFLYPLSNGNYAPNYPECPDCLNLFESLTGCDYLDDVFFTVEDSSFFFLRTSHDNKSRITIKDYDSNILEDELIEIIPNERILKLRHNGDNELYSLSQNKTGKKRITHFDFISKNNNSTIVPNEVSNIYLLDNNIVVKLDSIKNNKYLLYNKNLDFIRSVTTSHLDHFEVIENELIKYTKKDKITIVTSDRTSHSIPTSTWDLISTRENQTVVLNTFFNLDSSLVYSKFDVYSKEGTYLGNLTVDGIEVKEFTVFNNKIAYIGNTYFGPNHEQCINYDIKTISYIGENILLDQNSIRTIKDNDIKTSTIYPMPYSNIFRLDYNSYNDSRITVEIINSLGIKELNKQYLVKKGENYIDIIDNGRVGIKFLTIKNGDVVTTQKILKI